jgi:predicted acylesterase/phospholipase RssA
VVRTFWLASGGTALGALQVGPMEHALAIYGPPNEAIGVSTGAVNLALGLRTPGGLARLRQVWGEVDGTSFFQRPNLDFWHGLFTLTPLRKRIVNETGGAQYLCPTYAGVTNLDTGRYENLRIDNESVEDRADRVVASASQPLIHEPVTLGGAAYADGGVLQVLPRPVSTPAPGDQLFAFFAAPITGREEIRHPRTLADIGERCEELWVDRIVADCVAWLHAQAARGVKVTIVAHPHPGRPFDASPTTIAWRLGAGGQEAWDNRVVLAT